MHEITLPDRDVEDALTLLMARVDRLESLLVVLIEEHRVGMLRSIQLDHFVDSWRARH